LATLATSTASWRDDAQPVGTIRDLHPKLPIGPRHRRVKSCRVIVLPAAVTADDQSNNATTTPAELTRRKLTRRSADVTLVIDTSAEIHAHKFQWRHAHPGDL
jgi:hypothetical protein